MMRLRLLFLLMTSLPQIGWSHAAARMHHADIARAFEGYDCPDFQLVVRLVSDGMDNELPRRFRKEIGVVPGNHRILGHCWTFGDAIPHRVFEAVEKKHPGRSADFVELWKNFNAEVVGEVSRYTGLPKRQAQALAALIHDVHLLGDRTPDNRMVAYVLTAEEICRNIEKEMRVLWPTDREYRERVQERITSIMRDYPTECERAVALLTAINDFRWGERTNDRMEDDYGKIK